MPRPLASLASVAIFISLTANYGGTHASSTSCPVNSCRPCYSIASYGFDTSTVCNNTCVFRERVANTQASFDVLNAGANVAPTTGWNTRKLNEVIGDAVACGAALEASTGVITLDPGTYVVSAIGIGYMNDAMSARLSRVNDAGAYVSTVSLGSNQWSRKWNAHNNLQTVIYDHELVVTEAGSKYKLEQFYAYGNTYWNWGIGPGHFVHESYAETYGVGAQVTVRKKEEEYIVGSTCEFKETTSANNNHLGVGPTVLAWNDRKLNLQTGGNAAVCGASLAANTHVVTLQPGTYRVRGSSTTALSDVSFARLAKVDSNTGAFISTVALGSAAFSRLLNAPGTNANSMFLPLELTVAETSTFKLQMYFSVSTEWVWGLAAGYAEGEQLTNTFGHATYGENVSVHSQLSVVKLRTEEIGTTCLFRETVALSSSTQGFGGAVLGWNDRVLLDAVGNAGTCGATLDSGTGIVTLVPGTYVIEAMIFGYGSDLLVARLAEVDNSGVYVKTLAIGSAGFSRFGNSHTNDMSIIPETEFALATTTKFKIQSFYSGAYNEVFSKGVAPGWKMHQTPGMTVSSMGVSVAVGSQVSLRKVR